MIKIRTGSGGKKKKKHKKTKKIQSGEEDTTPRVPLGLGSNTEMRANQLGNVESFEKPRDVLI